ncbi:hypothetical protein [Paraburkholderia atlantica]|uniref:hypothetical protein n=1 Tax=Paraburkholderia atlantica TaxID=2654982 RepID=UPI00160F80F7|nr:hypothetical protein [Paraburkholderia atlantica]MBB5414075.1 hypothetical protein [Paraburkholderia atlantica]
MSRSQKNRKVRVDRNKTDVCRLAVMTRLMAAKVEREPLRESEVDRLEMPVLLALDAIEKGRGTPENWDVIGKALNQAWIFATGGGIGEEAKPYLVVALDAMRAVKQRYLDTGALTFEALELEAIRSAIEMRREQLKLATLGELHTATDVAHKYLYQKGAA